MIELDKMQKILLEQYSKRFNMSMTEVLLKLNNIARSKNISYEDAMLILSNEIEDDKNCNEGNYLWRKWCELHNYEINVGNLSIKHPHLDQDKIDEMFEKQCEEFERECFKNDDRSNER